MNAFLFTVMQTNTVQIVRSLVECRVNPSLPDVLVAFWRMLKYQRKHSFSSFLDANVNSWRKHEKSVFACNHLFLFSFVILFLFYLFCAFFHCSPSLTFSFSVPFSVLSFTELKIVFHNMTKFIVNPLRNYCLTLDLLKKVLQTWWSALKFGKTPPAHHIGVDVWQSEIFDR